MQKRTNLGAHYHCVFNLKCHLVLVTKYRHKIFTNEMLIELEALQGQLIASICRDRKSFHALSWNSETQLLSSVKNTHLETANCSFCLDIELSA